LARACLCRGRSGRTELDDGDGRSSGVRWLSSEGCDVQARSLVVHEVEGELVYADADGPTPTATVTSDSTAA
jgi:hypothetical protein